ncbi:WYL domain-containing protein [Clostridioides sp. ES-S-0049-02]|uniref:helix-turn-helix transcriptional regulator n=1 Tax=Clostridioides sp. ES-S-0049-02 TaxID=2770778 RepID=UPI001D10D1B0|nr:WYL domain-containing protein [Clostridioides sp. ES-S-0049-02]
MSKIKRLTDVWTYINDRQKFTIKELSEKFNLSTKTIQRYLIELNEMGLPIKAEKGRNGGYRVLNNSYIPPVIFTEKEVMSIVFAFKSLQVYNFSHIKKEIDSIIKKINYNRESSAKIGINNIEKYIEFIANYKNIDANIVTEFFRSSSNSCVLNIKYKSGNQLLEKKICPIGIYLNEGFWFSPVYDYESDNIILIRIDKVLEIEKVGESKKACISLKSWLDSVYSKLNEEMAITKKTSEIVHLHILLTKEGISKITRSFLDLDIELNENGSGTISKFIKYEEIDWWISTLFSIGKDAKVIEPKFMNKLLYDRAKELKYFYEENMI